MTATISGDGTSTLINLTTSGNTILGDASTDTLNVGNGGLVKDASGNVRIGTTSDLSAADKLTVVGGNFAVQRTSGITSFIGDNTQNGYAGTITNHAFALLTNSIERARIDSSGNLLVGATSRFSGFAADNKLYVESSTGDYICHFRSTQGTPYGPAISFSTAPNNTTSVFIDARDSSAQRFALRSNGGIANYSANNVNLSDERTKTDIQNAGGYLTKICAIPVHTFKYKDQTDDLLNLGVIAQEVETVAPELVDVSGFGETPQDGIPLKAIYQTDLQYALMKCIQEQQALIVSMREELDALKTKVGA